ncbi:MAG: glucosamine-6-phosphate deaminase [Candidatus Omnitrophica bacterium]|nr:glucosamine-6-phosphate deaminase [Candidatus Omnitrophota bacterium]MCM8809156.1 glucosamine-6-phosphate deaminase [Candidatus Omnitrophota bacterium]MCM8810504.1 glucosamine-6-phosphate deaminase [Candidatus Omnitrophota bacterium]
MRVIIKKNYEEMSKEAAEIIKNLIQKKANCVLGLATGSTPVGLYKELIRMHKEEGLDFSQVITFNLDEYYGLSPEHPQSYRYFMDVNLFNHINIKKENTHLPDGKVPIEKIEQYCESYEDMIKKAGGIDLQVVGIGGDGHIGFNEPGSSLNSRTRLVALDEQTIRDNSRFFEKIEDVPRFAITMGVGTILEAREIIFLANGKKKASIVAKAIEGPITSQISASVLQLHPKVTVILDEEAASELKRKEYYKFVYEAEKRIGLKLF